MFSSDIDIYLNDFTVSVSSDTSFSLVDYRLNIGNIIKILPYSFAAKRPCYIFNRYIFFFKNLN